MRLSTKTFFKHDDLTIELTKSPSPKPDNDKLIFGQHFSDHMLSIKWTADNGWLKPCIHPIMPLSIHPGAKVLHYASEIFEGMKAYWGVDDQIRLFRPIENMKRMNQSAVKASLPEFDNNELVKCIKELVRVDEQWVPRSQKSTLYLRPTMIGTEASLGVATTKEAHLFVITGPVGPYYPTGLKPVSLYADPKYVRAWPGGAGDTKMGANYGPTCYVASKAQSHDCQQVLWLDGTDKNLITEVGTMNVFLLMVNKNGERELLTPPLNGTILPGVTRKSLIDLAKQWNEFPVREAFVSMEDLEEALLEGRVLEMFGAGTACVVSPIERILYKGRNLHIPTMDLGAPIAMRFLKELYDIQFGRVKSHPWQELVSISEKIGEPISSTVYNRET